MDAEIRAVDREKPSSEGHNLAVRGAQLELALKPYDGLRFGEHKDQHYVEVRASKWEGTTESTFVGQLNAADLQQLLEFACTHGMVTVPRDPRIVQLVGELYQAVSVRE